jgi:prolyl-tRNA editing enzyme YbaK/EbsC (Cys-tRNA(Pro) deacylase)
MTSSPLVKRVTDACMEASLIYNIYKVEGDYYEKTLEERKEILRAPSVDNLCKTLLFENSKFKEDQTHAKHSKFCLVLIQYTDRLSTKKLNQLMRSFAPGQSSKVFNMRIARKQAGNELVGFPTGGMTPLGTLVKLPIIISQKIADLDLMFLGCGELDVKISFNPKEFTEKTDKVTIADISE